MNKPNCTKLDDIQNISNITDLREWLKNKARSYNLKYFLAHVEDGVIWGYFDSDGNLITPTEPENLFPKCKFPVFQYETLQQCRAFGDSGEIMFWQTGVGLKGRVIEDDEKTEYIPEQQIIWGTKAEQIRNNFTLLTDGSQGLRHAVPLINIEFDSNKKLHRPLRLSVRHYLDYDETIGLTRIYLSRLVSIKPRRIINDKTSQ